MNFIRDVYQTTASPNPDRPHSSAGYNFQSSQGLSHHFNPVPQQTYPPLRPHSFSNAAQHPYTPNFTNSYAVQPMMHTPFLAPVAPPQPYFPQPHSNPVSPMYAPAHSLSWPPPPPPPLQQFGPTPVTYQSQAFLQDHPPPYSYDPPSPVSPMVEQRPSQQIPFHGQHPSTSPPEHPRRSSVSQQAEHLARPYQWQSPDSFLAVQEAAQHDQGQQAENRINPPLPPRPASFQRRPSSSTADQPNRDRSYQANSDQSTGSQILHRPSNSKPFPPGQTSSPVHQDQPHQAPYDQPASVEFPRFDSTGTIPHVEITPAATELPASPVRTSSLDQQSPMSHSIAELDATGQDPERNHSKTSAQSQVPIPLIAELPG